MQAIAEETYEQQRNREFLLQITPAEWDEVLQLLVEYVPGPHRREVGEACERLASAAYEQGSREGIGAVTAGFREMWRRRAIW